MFPDFFFLFFHILIIFSQLLDNFNLLTMHLNGNSTITQFKLPQNVENAYLVLREKSLKEKKGQNLDANSTELSILRPVLVTTVHLVWSN